MGVGTTDQSATVGAEEKTAKTEAWQHFFQEQGLDFTRGFLFGKKSYRWKIIVWLQWSTQIQGAQNALRILELNGQISTR